MWKAPKARISMIAMAHGNCVLDTIRTIEVDGG
jgi:hypothetical protein